MTLNFTAEIKEGRRRSHSEETKAKLRLANLGRHHSLESKRKISLKMKGRPAPLSCFKKGHSVSEETRKKISKALSGKCVSMETRAKLRQINLGRKHSEETKRKIGLANNISMRGNKNGLGKKCSEERKLKIGLANKGERSSFWKGGVSSLRQQIYNNFKYRQWRSDIFTRDDFICQKCGVKGGNLQSHHLKPFSKILEEYKLKTLEQALNCEVLWNINNGITICLECHKLTDNFRGKGNRI